METRSAIRRIQLGESLDSIAGSLHTEMCERAGLDPKEAAPSEFRDETTTFMRELCRELGERHAGDVHIGHALREWVGRNRDYEAWDALLSGFRFEGRERFLAQGRQMFPGTLTAHWQST